MDAAEDVFLLIGQSGSSVHFYGVREGGETLKGILRRIAQAGLDSLIIASNLRRI